MSGEIGRSGETDDDSDGSGCIFCSTRKRRRSSVELDRAARLVTELLQESEESGEIRRDALELDRSDEPLILPSRKRDFHRPKLWVMTNPPYYADAEKWP